MPRDRSGGSLDTVVGPDSYVKGDVRVNGSMRIDGIVEGRIEVAGSLLTGPRSQVKGDVSCREAVVAGKVEGNISATDGVELQTGAQVFGDIGCKGLVIHRDVVFNGTCSMKSGDRAAVEDKVWLCRDEEQDEPRRSKDAS